MKAAILIKQNKPLVVDELELPLKLEYGQVLVKVLSTSICDSQIEEISGISGPNPNLPHLLGQEGVGKVISTGIGVTTVKRNDYVVLHSGKGVGIEAPIPKYIWDNKLIAGDFVTTFNSHAIVSENRLTEIDPIIPIEIAPLFGSSVPTAFSIINNEAKLKMGQSILIVGCGAIGMLLIQGAYLVTGNPIVAIETNERKRYLALNFGADESYESFEELNKFFDSFDVVVDCTGKPNIINSCYEVTKPGGKLILVGKPKATLRVVFNNMRQHYCGKTILNNHEDLINPTIDIPKYIELYKKGKLKLDQLISQAHPLDRINKAIAEEVTNSDIIKTIIYTKE